MPPVRRHVSAAAPPAVCLVADIGGTFARFGLAQGGRLCAPPLTLPRDAGRDLPELCVWALRTFHRPVDGAAIAVAAPVSAGHARMTNVAWVVDEAALGRALALERVLLINDFAALALALPTLAAGDVLAIPPAEEALRSAPPAFVAAAPRVVFGPGTGLGVAALVHHDGQPIVLDSEGGHIGFAAATPFEQQVLDYAASRFERVSWERLLSGPGLELIDAVSRRELGGPAAARPAPRIVAAAAQGRCAAASQSVACFAGLLGSFGGDLALLFRAAGGVVIGGGIAARIAPLIALPELRRRFSQKGRFSAWLGALPLSILLDPHAALRGAARAFAERFAEGDA